MWTYKELPIGEIRNLIEDYEIEIDSPDGYQPVSMFVDKGMWEEYKVEFDNGTVVRCNEGHLFETTLGWMNPIEITSFRNRQHNLHVHTDKGLSQVVTVWNTGSMIPIVDIQVDHPNHRYYSNGISSHNTNVGKTLVKCHLAASMLAAGKNVLYISMEMAEQEIAKRIDANLLDIDINSLGEIPKTTFMRKVETLKGKTHGKLIVKEYPTGGGSASQFRVLIDELRIKREFVPDIVMIDYLNICASAKMKMGNSVNTYVYMKSITEELRALAIERDIPILTSTQFSRGGQSSTDADLEQVSDSHGTSMTADFMCALMSTEELANLGQIMIKQLKNRYTDKNKNKRFVVGIDYNKMRLYNVSQNEQVEDDDKPVMDKGEFGEGLDAEMKSKFKSRRKGNFEGFEFD
jgi:hypothetical protein